MRTVGSRELKNRLGAYLARVKRGESIVVTDRGKTVARLVPASDGDRQPTIEEKLQELAAAGHIRLAPQLKDTLRFKPVRVKGKPASRMIIEDRR